MVSDALWGFGRLIFWTIISQLQPAEAIELNAHIRAIMIKDVTLLITKSRQLLANAANNGFVQTYEQFARLLQQNTQVLPFLTEAEELFSTLQREQSFQHAYQNLYGLMQEYHQQHAQCASTIHATYQARINQTAKELRLLGKDLIAQMIEKKTSISFAPIKQGWDEGNPRAFLELNRMVQPTSQEAVYLQAGIIASYNVYQLIYNLNKQLLIQ